MRDQRLRDVGVGGEHRRRLVDLAHAVVALVGHRSEPGQLLGQRHRAGRRHLSVVHAEQHDPAAGAGEFGAAGEARLGAGGVDHDVVLAAERAAAEALGGGALVRVAALEVGAQSLAREGGDGEQPDRPAADAGSTRQASSTASPSGSATRLDAGTRARSASPPSTKIPRLACSPTQRCVCPAAHWAQDPHQIVGSTAYGTPPTTPANSWPYVKPPRPIAANVRSVPQMLLDTTSISSPSPVGSSTCTNSGPPGPTLTARIGPSLLLRLSLPRPPTR